MRSKTKRRLKKLRKTSYTASEKCGMCNEVDDIVDDMVTYRMGCEPCQQTQNICITFIQRRPNVFDVGPTLYKCYTNVLCLLGCESPVFSNQVSSPVDVSCTGHLIRSSSSWTTPSPHGHCQAWDHY